MPMGRKGAIEFLSKRVEALLGMFTDCNMLKSPGVDGLNTLFFQSQWDTIGPVVCDFIKREFAPIIGFFH